MKLKLVLSALLVLGLSGCLGATRSTTPGASPVLSKIGQRQLETHYFDNTTRAELMNALIATAQDYGHRIDFISPELGYMYVHSGEYEIEYRHYLDSNGMIVQEASQIGAPYTYGIRVFEASDGRLAARRTWSSNHGTSYGDEQQFFEAVNRALFVQENFE